MRRRAQFTITALALGWGGFVSAQTADFVSPLIGFHEAGVVCAPQPSGVRDAPDTVAGTTHVVDQPPPFVTNGRVVPAVLGMGFGVRAGLDAPAGRDVMMTVTHPPLTGSGATRQSFVTYVGPLDDPGITFYQFDETYELVPGEWTMTASTGPVTLYQVTFTVVDPSVVPDLANACASVDLLS